MIELPKRNFEIKPVESKQFPLMIMLLGESGSGKTYTALELATGIQEVYGGKIVGIDTERKATAMAMYKDYFQFHHLPLLPPHSPLDYQKAITDAIAAGGKVIIIDSMSHEHDGEGGYLDIIENIVRTRGKAFQGTALVQATSQRKQLNRYMLDQIDVAFILCYRAHDKVKPIKGDDWKRFGMQPITTSALRFESTARYLLTAGSQGVPLLQPEERAERVWTNNPKQFQGWVKEDTQLNRALGKRMAEWAKGKHSTPSKNDVSNQAAGSSSAPPTGLGEGPSLSDKSTPAAPSRYELYIEMFRNAESVEDLKLAWSHVLKHRSGLTGPQFADLEVKKNVRKKHLMQEVS